MTPPSDARNESGRGGRAGEPPAGPSPSRSGRVRGVYLGPGQSAGSRRCGCSCCRSSRCSRPRPALPRAAPGSSACRCRAARASCRACGSTSGTAPGSAASRTAPPGSRTCAAQAAAPLRRTPARRRRRRWRPLPTWRARSSSTA
ncbi:hypothetical protein FOCC_FOCC017292 [Frankliniella occidentalis]|nr:hypothetical protein FOCC_FOCC017292 [Frankliniella occidentalis]